MLGFEYKNIYYYNKNKRLINERSFINHDHFNRSVAMKKQLNKGVNKNDS